MFHLRVNEGIVPIENRADAMRMIAAGAEEVRLINDTWTPVKRVEVVVNDHAGARAE